MRDVITVVVLFPLGMGSGENYPPQAILKGHYRRFVRDLIPAYDVYLNDVAYWHNVPAPVWDYTLGGYAVLKKWLSYREKRVLGRDLTPEEARTFTGIARRIAAILLLHPDLDANYQAVKQNVHR